jgi:hypothetical protein
LVVNLANIIASAATLAVNIWAFYSAACMRNERYFCVWQKCPVAAPTLAHAVRIESGG